MRVTTHWIAIVVGLAGLATTGFSAVGDTRLADAAMHHDRAAVRALLSQHVDVNSAQVDGTTALDWAVRSDDLEMAKLLLGAGADVKAANRYGVTPFLLACQNGSADVMEAMLGAGADPNAILSEEQTALMMTARSGNAVAVKLLLDHGAKVNAKEATRGQTALMWAAAEAHPDVVHVLVSQGADVNAHTNVFPQPPQALERVSSPYPVGGMTALLFAARQNDADSVSILLTAGAGANDAASDGSTPLLVAVLNGHFKLATFLLDHGANPNAADRKGETPLYAAVDLHDLDWSTRSAPPREAMDSLEMIKVLLARGANPNAQVTKKIPLRGNAMFDRRWLNTNGVTPLIRAAQSGDAELMRLLLAHGADPKMTTADHTNALMVAAGIGWTEGITRGSSLDALEATKVCLDVCGDVNAANDTGYTALLGAAGRGANEVVQLLVDHGANLDAKARGGLSAVDVALGKRTGSNATVHEDTAALLRQLASAKTQPGQ